MADTQGAEVPAEVRLPNYVGPIPFTSEWDGAKYPALCDLLPSAPDELRHLRVLGTIRDASSNGGFFRLGAYVLDEAGQVVLVDLNVGCRVAPVNRSLRAFVESLAALLDWWEANADAVSRRDTLDLRTRILRLDPSAFDDPEGYWSQWVEGIETFG